MSRFYTHTPQYKKLQNDHHTGTGVSTTTVDSSGGSINNNNKITGKQHFYQVAAQCPPAKSTTSGAVGSNGGSFGIASDKLADRSSPSASSMQQTKMSTHLLDHGYGATPQPQQFGREAISSSGKTAGSGKDFRITNYYKVSKVRENKHFCQFSL